MTSESVSTPEMPSLDELGILAGTDKGSLGHGYLRQYERQFGPLRHEPITLIEIGVDRGGSLRMWTEYFSRALVVGVDINPDCRRHSGDRRIVEIGSQIDPQFLRRLGEQYKPDIIIDDGSHRADHIVFTFEHLYPLLRPGGRYVVEDIHFHAGADAGYWRGDAASPPQDYFLTLARLAACPASVDAFDRTLSTMTDWVEFSYGAIVIGKRPDTSATDPIATLRPLVKRANQSRIWSIFSAHILNNNGDPREAVAASRRAIELEQDNAGFYHQLSIALERSGDFNGAMQASSTAVQLDPQFEPFTQRMTDLKERLPPASYPPSA